MGSREVANILLQHGARPQLNMWAAAGLGMLDVVQSFWESPQRLKPGAGQMRTRRTPDGGWGKMPPPEDYASLVSEAFYIAGRNGHVEVAKFLLEKGADINCRGFFGAPGLHWAAINGHKKMVEFLIANGADLGLRDEQFSSTALNWALEGVRMWLAEGLKAPATIVKSTEEYREREYPLSEFLDERCLVYGGPVTDPKNLSPGRTVLLKFTGKAGYISYHE